jgi:hypothetical protein
MLWGRSRLVELSVFVAVNTQRQSINTSQAWHTSTGDERYTAYLLTRTGPGIQFAGASVSSKA